MEELLGESLAQAENRASSSAFHALHGAGEALSCLGGRQFSAACHHFSTRGSHTRSETTRGDKVMSKIPERDPETLFLGPLHKTISIQVSPLPWYIKLSKLEGPRRPSSFHSLFSRQQLPSLTLTFDMHVFLVSWSGRPWHQ